MAWIRVSDTAAFYPALLGVAEHDTADERSVNEVFGWWLRLATLSAQHLTDYVVTYAVVLQVSGTRAEADRLIALAEFAGLLATTTLDGGRRAVTLLNDPEFVHLKTSEEVAWEKKRREDNGNPGVTVLVRLRDGDACRYCGKVVNFRARTGKLAGTYDHRPPGQPADAERSVVACSSCNATRGNAPLEVADALLPLLPVPAEKYYHAGTRDWFQAYAALITEAGLTVPERRPDQLNLRAGTVLQRPDTAPTTGVRPEAAATPPTSPQVTAPSEPDRTQVFSRQEARDGTGRDGTGRYGPVREGPGQAGTGRDGQVGARRRRGRRGRRGGRSTQEGPR